MVSGRPLWAGPLNHVVGRQSPWWQKL